MSAPLIPISGLAVSNRQEMGKNLAKGGCSSSSCGSSAGPADMDPETWAKVKDHPCYSEEAHHYFARMHVAVSPACNIQCNYCNRKYDCANESRPGVVSERLTPEQAARKVLAVAAEVPQLSVLGIAGPGDAAYDWRKTKATFDLVSQRLPDIKLCLSSNGLALPDHIDEIVAMNIDHVTITINAIDPEIGAQIVPWIFYERKRRTGVEAATILRDRQLQALEMLHERGVLVKVNSVLIPGINDDHLIEVNKAVKARGAFLHNIMPLISDPAHGTHFGLTGQRGPTAAELKKVQDACAGGANLMRHCRQCRADAVGLLGEDRGQDFTLDKLPEEIEDAPEAREAYRAWVAEERKDRQAAAGLAEQAAAAAEAPTLFAVCTRGSGRINLHFGKATEFQIYEADADGISFVGHRRADNYCLGGYGDAERMDEIIKVLDDVPYVLCQMIGNGPRKRLADAGIEAIDSLGEEYIETAIASILQSRRAHRDQAAQGA
ncbi:nitrogenase cofactor biosynthesis protein NifB [Rhodovulum adriaticum]|uniref:FeMo cofactor biosynthesis protein NifB n=1 Tax=Rhodovulum adriaticum TaxID=35804 RepID=A0A4V2SLC1_RHOAD|nr:nitrogenase cofactor biosynthesis protein NifB [Rhodovulum adriaticum]MBK1636347.1 nitrogenase cofactor biosynthesis protein NifB [Rhodovulum adriaticum]TCP22836.1 nitrogen fixation protein NifB [Rhodovulum adriaticum]